MKQETYKCILAFKSSYYGLVYGYGDKISETVYAQLSPKDQKYFLKQ